MPGGRDRVDRAPRGAAGVCRRRRDVRSVALVAVVALVGAACSADAGRSAPPPAPGSAVAFGSEPSDGMRASSAVVEWDDGLHRVVVLTVGHPTAVAAPDADTSHQDGVPEPESSASGAATAVG